MSLLARRQAVLVFLAFAFAYFFSALLRAVTATLAPTLTQEFQLHASDLGLLAGGYFLGFAAIQLPLGTWLDRHGPKQVILGFLLVAVLGCAAFALATSFAGAAGGARAVRRRRERLPDGAAHRLPALVHAGRAAARQLLDADDRLARAWWPPRCRCSG